MAATERFRAGNLRWHDRAYITILIAVLVAGGYSVYREALPFIYSGGSSAEKKHALASWSPQPAISYFGNRFYVDSCIETLSNVMSVSLEPEVTAKAATNCLAFAKLQTASSPANAYVYAMAAFSHGTLQDKASAISALEQSRSIAPSESWLASLRLRQFRLFKLSLEPSVVYLANQDIMTLGKTNMGRNWLAQWYKNDESQRVLIVQSIEALPDTDKLAFLQSVRR